MRLSYRKGRRRNNDFSYLEKSSSEPDLSGTLNNEIELKFPHNQNIYSHFILNDNKKPNTVRFTDPSTPIFTSRWKKQPHECITVDELKFYRRRKPPGILNGSISNTNTCNEYSKKTVQNRHWVTN